MTVKCLLLALQPKGIRYCEGAGPRVPFGRQQRLMPSGDETSTLSIEEEAASGKKGQNVGTCHVSNYVSDGAIKCTLTKLA